MTAGLLILLFFLIVGPPPKLALITPVDTPFFFIEECFRLSLFFFVFQMQCLKASNKIILHSKELDIIEKDVTLKQITTANETVDVPITSHTYAKENDFYIIMLGQRLVQRATYRLYIPFRGKLEEGLAGFYRSSYVDKSNKTK